MCFRLTVGWVGVLSFITSFSFPYLLSTSWAGQGAFWMYSLISFVGFLFIAIFVPETRGHEIRDGTIIIHLAKISVKSIWRQLTEVRGGREESRIGEINSPGSGEKINNTTVFSQTKFLINIYCLEV